jgi:hypothetical protein
MDMDELIFEMGQPNEIITTPEWTEWWAVDETGLHLEYADGYEPEQYYGYSETAWDEEFATTKSFTIDVSDLPKSHFQHMADRWEEVFGKVDYKKSRLLEQEKEIDERYEPRYYPYPISTDAYDDPDYLDFLQGAIDEYNQWYTQGNGVITNTPPPEPQEESIVVLPKKDGLILPDS